MEIVALFLDSARYHSATTPGTPASEKLVPCGRRSDERAEAHLETVGTGIGIEFVTPRMSGSEPEPEPELSPASLTSLHGALSPMAGASRRSRSPKDPPFRRSL